MPLERRANGILGPIRQSLPSWLRKLILAFCSPLVRLYLEHCVQSNKGRWAQTEMQKVPFEHQKILFHVRMTEYWHRLARDTVESPFLEILKSSPKSSPDSVLGNLP